MKTTIQTEEKIQYAPFDRPDEAVPATRVQWLHSDAKGSFLNSALYIDDCAYCESEKEAQSTFFPSHFASSRCQSGKRNHCTCDCCF